YHTPALTLACSSPSPSLRMPTVPATDRRADFYTAPGITYLNCATQGPMPRVAIAAVERALDLKRTPHLLTDADYFLYPDRYRQAVGRLVGARPEEIAVTDSTTAGLMLLVNGLDWREGDEVVIPEGTFPANRFPWHSLARKGVRVVSVPERPADGDGGEVGRFAAALSPRTRVVSVGWVSFSTGLRYDLAALSALCGERGILFAVDGTQGIGGLELSLAATPCDLLACSGYKWLLGPYGLGFAWLRPELAERLVPANTNWMAVRGAEDFNRLADRPLEWAPGARRFDRNETASFFDTAGATAAVEYLLEVTPRAVESHVRTLLDRLLAGLPAGYRPVSALGEGQRSNILSIAAAAPEATHQAFDRLTAAGIRASRREGAIRFSPHLYNTEDEIDRVLELLA
ncbi:MAG TPA: aminotransferase class V-fold PLP-dependent enzyme, partial [Thermoanaerobaculia bacterium]|nr:aminotransferase class V-fold PLP-dependent enzyme [Thermoanaerobaculia bacterium]